MKRFFLIIGLLLSALAVFSQDDADIVMKARALVERGKQGEAINMLSQKLLSSTDFRLFLELAEARAGMGDYAGAINAYNKANSAAPGSGEYGIARISALKGDIKNSLAHLELSINSQYKRSEKEIMLDPAFSVIENSQEWRSFWKTDRYTYLESHVTEMEYYLNAGNREEAVKILDDMKSQYPGENMTVYATAMADNSLQKYPEAATLLTKLLSDDSRNEDYLKLLASVQISSGNYAGASDTYTTLLNNGSIDAGLYLKRAECYRKTGENDKAIADLQKYLSMYPDNRDALSLSGKITAENGDNLKAIEYFSENLKLHPNDPQCYIDRGNSYFNARSWDNAANDYSMSLDLKPENGDVWLNRGISLLNLGKVQDACHDFRKALFLGNKKAASYINTNCLK